MTPEENDRLTRVGKGTPMGELMRRYWHPIAAVAEFDDKPPTQAVKPVRLMGEDLVLYRDLSGGFGLIDRHCSHRRADLSFGYCEETGLRCNYHGWKFDQAGACISRPFEDRNLPQGSAPTAPQSVALKAYEARAHAGMVWAYMGPKPAPLLPNFEPFTYENCFFQIVFSEIPCNWLQCQENGMDPVHFEWLHANWSQALKGNLDKSATHMKIGFDEWEQGFRYKRVLENTNEDDRLWQAGRLTILPNIFVPNHFEWRIPVDDYNTLAILWVFDRVPNDMEPFKQDRIPYWHAPLFDAEGKPLIDRIVHQDALACYGQGPIMDRTQEHLGSSDRGVVMLRRQLERDMVAVERGEDPKGVLREGNGFVPWPVNLRGQVDKGLDREAWHRQQAIMNSAYEDFFFLLDGQPEHVRAEFNAAMGL